MAILKMCPKCNTSHNYGETCPNGCNIKAKRNRNREYDKIRQNKAFYNSKGWLTARKACIARDSICLWSYYKNNIIIPGKVVHHIIEVDEDKNKKLDVNNLIYLSAQAHNYIHSLYKENRASIQVELLEMVRKHKAGVV